MEAHHKRRFHDMHVELMDVLSGYGASRREGLGQMSELLGAQYRHRATGRMCELLAS